MRLARPRSIAIRLTIGYAVSAFLLVAVVAWAMYRRVETNRMSEADRILREALDAVERAGPAAFVASPPSTTRSPRVRLLDKQCHVTAGLPETSGPPPVCEDSANAGGGRTWTAPDRGTWRGMSRPLSPALRAALPGALWVEVVLDRSLDAEALAGHRRMLAGILPATLLLTTVLGYWLAISGLAPLDTLSLALARIDARSLDRTLDVREAPTEIRILVSAFDGVRERLNAAFASLTQFSTELAHELRTPLHVLRQQTDVALTRARTAEEYREVLLSSLDELDRLHRMVDDILFLARAEDPRSRIERTEMSVGSELADVADYLEPLAAEKDIALVAEASPALRLSADRMMLRRALVNLVANAIRHTPRGGRVSLDAASRDGLVAIQVRDTGSGIPGSALPHVFDRFYRVPGTDQGSADGTGLGLALVRGIVTLHGGWATVSSSLGEGTLVTLVFPIEKSASWNGAS